MTYPNSPVDNKPKVWGWPWHGMIEGTPSTDPTPSELILPSGARMQCSALAGDAHNTHLWDIGMPTPDVESDNPDERWLNKAIIRSSYSGDYRKFAFCYANMDIGNFHPMYVPGFGVRMRRIEVGVRGTGETARLAVSLFISRSFVTEQLLSRVQLQLPVVSYQGSPLYDYRIQLMDESPNGRSALYWVAPRLMDGATERITVGRTLLEVSITGDPNAGFGITHRIVSPYSIQATAQRYPEAADKGNFVRVQWASSNLPGADTVEVWEAEGQPAGYPYRGVDGPQGTAVQYQMLESPVWAWYNPDGSVDVIRWRWELNHVETYASAELGYDQSYTSHNQVTVTLSSSSADVAMGHVDYFSQNAQRPPGGTGTAAWLATRTIYGETTGSSSGTTPWDWSNRLTPIYGSEPPPDPNPLQAGAVYPDGVIILSNNIVGTIKRNFSIDGSAPTHSWCGSALYPGGVDSGVEKFDTANPNGGTLGAWRVGSYNPITGEIVRNRTDKYCSWV